MDKKIYRAVSKRADGFCELCRSYKGEYLQLHHIVSGLGKRLQHESKETCMMLCQDCHREAHGNRRVDLALKLLAQEKYKSKGFTDSQIRKKMGGKFF